MDWRHAFKLDTDIPIFENMREKPDYFKKFKDMEGFIVLLSPDEYLRRVEMGFQVPPFSNYLIMDMKLANAYAKAMLRGDKFPMPHMEYTRGHFAQEGRHRALAAKVAGIDLIPVLIVFEPDEKDLYMFRYDGPLKAAEGQIF